MIDMSLRRMATPAGGQWRLAPVAGTGFVLSWVVGLLIFSSSTQVSSSGAEVLRGFAGHHTVAALQYVLTEGAAAVALAPVVLALGRAAGSMRLVVVGLSAVVVSLIECIVGVHLSDLASDAHTAGSLASAIDRLDGLKMFLLAGLAIGTVSAVRRGTLRLPSWLGYLTVALAVTLVASGIGYLLLLDSLAVMAWVSLPLLLAWVLAIGGCVGARRP